MAEFIGIRNENEFYFAHYLSSLMDDDLQKEGAAEELKKRVVELGAVYRKTAVERVRAGRRSATKEERAAAREASRVFHRAAAKALGYGDVFRSPGHVLFAGANLVIPVSGVLEGKNHETQVLLIESETGDSREALHEEGGILSNFLSAEQLEAEGLPEEAKRKLGDRTLIGHGHTKAQRPTWENLLSQEIFAAVKPPRFVIALGDDFILLADREKWAERRALIFKLDEIYDRREVATMRAMGCLLAREALAPDGATPLPDRLDAASHRNAFGVSKSLRYAMRDAIELLGNAILQTNPKARESAAAGAEHFSAAALSKECILVMYRFLFVLFLESRRDLGYFETRGKDDIFRSAYGLDHLRDLETVPLLTEADRQGHYFDASIKQLFDKIWKGAGLEDKTVCDGGADTFRIQPLKAHLFDPERTQFFNEAQIPNETWQRIVYSLSIGEAGTGKKKRKGRISYAQLGIQQLGAVYEALLSYTGFYAKEDLYEVAPAAGKSAAEESEDEEGDEAGEDEAKGASVDVFETGYFVTKGDIESGKYKDSEIVSVDGKRVCHPKGSFIYRMAGRDRERSASYYTPQELTKTLVRLALKERIPEDMPADEIMQLTVCEPAMGSAAFLNETIDQLADLYLTRKMAELKEVIAVEKYAEEKARVKMVIADTNVFGVDLNPTAADLAEVSLWLGSIGGEKLPTAPGRSEPYIPWFGTQIKCGNSIVGARREIVLKDGTRRMLGFDEKFPEDEGAVWHFLLPDEGMAPKFDKVVKDLVGKGTVEAFRDWGKAFRLPKKIDEKMWARLVKISVKLDERWRTAAKDIAALDARTRDDVKYFGHEPVKKESQSIQDKDQILNLEYSRDVYGNVDYKKSLDSVTDYFRVKTILDLWCSLWFWPFEEAGKLPSWEDYVKLLELLACDEFTVAFRATFEDFEREQLAKSFKKDPTLENLNRLFPFMKVAARVAERQHFLHWELEFAPIFVRRGGFDLVIGNPPWVKLQWNEQGILSEYDPRLAIRNASEVARLRAGVFENYPMAQGAYLQEFSDTTDTKGFLGADTNYPMLAGVQTNLYKFFVPLAFRLVNKEGVTGYIHPEGIYNDPQGGLLRAAIYPRLRLHAHFRNELILFDIGHGREYGLNIYGLPKGVISFRSISKLYHPTTLLDSLEGAETEAELPLERDAWGRWNLTGHPDRVVPITEESLGLFAMLYDRSGTPALQARLPVIYTRQFLEPILTTFAAAPKMASLDYGVSVCWDETNSKKDGTIRRQTGFVADVKELIYSAPQFFVGNPINKTPRIGCKSKGDYDLVDWTVMSEDYWPRMNYVRAVERGEYEKRMPQYHGDLITDCFRVFCRHMVSASSERTLIPCFVPKGVAHVNSVIEFIFNHRMDMSELTSIFGAWFSLPFDWLVRSANKDNFMNDTARLLPRLKKDSRIAVRALLLNCLNRDYSEFWARAWDEAYRGDGWLSGDGRLTAWGGHIGSGGVWTGATPLRTALDRRQALIELDVLVTRALGLSLEDLILMYRVSFTVLRKYDATTYYDRRGRCVFSTKKGESYLSRKEWEGIRGMESGCYEKVVKEAVFGDEAVERTVVYEAPFGRKDREADYREAWEALERREGK